MRLPPIKPIPRGEHMPVSLSQELLLNFIDQSGASSKSFYNLFRIINLTGFLNFSALEQAFNELIRRHEVLRTTFGYVGGQPVQLIAEAQSLEIPLIDLEYLPAHEREDRAYELAAEDIQKIFDLSKDILLRAVVLRLAENRHVLVLTTHHIASDGWSMRILLQELFTLYRAFSNGQPSPLPDLPVQYADFAYWQRQWTQGDTLEKNLDFWRSYLRGWSSINLPVDRPRPPVPSFKGAHQSLALSASLTNGLKTFSHRQGVTFYMTLLAAFKALLCLYTGQDDLLVSTPIANRTRSETEGLIGFFTNNLLLRTSIASDPTFREVLNRVRHTALEAYDNQELPLMLIMNEMQIGWSQVMCVLQPTLKLKFMELPDLTPSIHMLDPGKTTARGVSKRDLSLYMVEATDGLKGVMEYSTDIFDEAAIENLIANFQHLLESVLVNPDQPLSKLDSQLEWNVTRTHDATHT